MRTNLQAEASRIRHRIDKITDEYYEDKVTSSTMKNVLSGHMI